MMQHLKDSVVSKEELVQVCRDLGLSKRSEGSDQDIVILGIRWFNGHVDDVNWIVLCILKGTKIKKSFNLEEKKTGRVKHFYIVATLTLTHSSS